ncbi:MAG: YncE family protein [Caulobacterales bacterium]
MKPATIAALSASAALLAVLSPQAAQAQAAPAYKVTRSVALGAPDRWDYVVFDPASRRVYVAHGDTVSVVDGRDGRMIGKVEGIAGGTHGIGISTATGKGYTDDGKAGQAVVFDLKTLKAGARIPAAADADAIAFDPASGHVFVIEGDPASITVIDPKTDKVVATIDGGGKLEYGASDDRGHLYVNGAAKREIVSVNTRTNAVDGHWPMPDCANPHGLAIDTARHRLFSSCVNGQLAVVNTDTGRVVATVPIGKGTDAAAYDPKRHLVFSSNGLDGTLTVIRQKDADTYAPVATIPTAISGRTMSIDPQTGRLYVAALDMEPATTAGARPKPRPGTLRLMFLDPSH